MEDLYRLEQGHYPKEFLAKIIAWNRGHVAIDNHIEVAKAAAVKGKNK